MANRNIEHFDFNVDVYERLRKLDNYTHSEVAMMLNVSTKTLARCRKSKTAPEYIIKGLSNIFTVSPNVLVSNKRNKVVVSEESYSPLAFINEFIDPEYTGIPNKRCIDYTSDDLRGYLDANGYESYWDFPLSEIDEIVENHNTVALVDDGYTLRWFEVPNM